MAANSNDDRDPISEYYENCRVESNRAWEKVVAKREELAKTVDQTQRMKILSELHKLEKLWLRVSNTGD